jgi:hypothetical protein
MGNQILTGQIADVVHHKDQRPEYEKEFCELFFHVGTGYLALQPQSFLPQPARVIRNHSGDDLNIEI